MSFALQCTLEVTLHLGGFLPLFMFLCFSPFPAPIGWHDAVSCVIALLFHCNPLSVRALAPPSAVDCSYLGGWLFSGA